MAGIEGTQARTLAKSSAAFLEWIDGWLADRAPLDLASYLQSNNIGPERVAIVSVDMIAGFCYEGRLASLRIAGVVDAVAALFQRAYELGVRQFVLPQEYHSHDAPEFDQYGPHGIRDTQEAETVAALRALPFAGAFRLVRKNSIHPALGTDFEQWLNERPSLDTFIVVGDCTDLCAYQSAMYLKLRGNAQDRRVAVIVPQNCVQTYDMPVATAQQRGVMPHDGDLTHAMFLYSMALNGIEVVRSIA